MVLSLVIKSWKRLPIHGFRAKETQELFGLIEIISSSNALNRPIIW
jgi:hypothetical protein